MIWKIHPNFPQYKISDQGDVVRRLVSKKSKVGGNLNGRVLVSGYRQFNLLDCKGRRCLVRANRLVAETFLGFPPSTKHHAAHNDGNRLNNRADNLRWATAKENCADIEKHGRKNRGEKVKNAILTDAEVIEMRRLYSGKRGEITRLGKQFGIENFSSARRILMGETYGHLPALDKKRAAFNAS